MDHFVFWLPVLIIGLLAYAIWSFWHTPKKEIDIKTRALIEQYGLKHFTNSYYIDSILEKGIQPCPSRKMKNKEANLVWLYLNVDYKKHKKAILKKRKDSDAVIILKNISPQQISNMRMRNDGAITFNGTLKTDSMIPFGIEEYGISKSNSVFGVNMNRTHAEKLIAEAKELNDGVWINHSYNVARLAEKISSKANMDSEKAYIIGLLHDIGRRNGTMQARHALEGYNYLTSIGFEDGARICMTHTFQYKDVDAIYDTWDCSEDEKQFIKNYLDNITYDDYDKLIQLCDALSLLFCIKSSNVKSIACCFFLHYL